MKKLENRLLLEACPANKINRLKYFMKEFFNTILENNKNNKDDTDDKKKNKEITINKETLDMSYKNIKMIYDTGNYIDLDFRIHKL